MIRGAVQDVDGFLHPMVTIDLIGADGERHPVDSLLDTGFTGSLTLPPETLSGLGFRFTGRLRANLANGETALFNTYLGKAEWHGEEKYFEVWETRGDSLIGMQMLHGNRVVLHVVSEGVVEIDKSSHA